MAAARHPVASRDARTMAVMAPGAVKHTHTHTCSRNSNLDHQHFDRLIGKSHQLFQGYNTYTVHNPSPLLRRSSCHGCHTPTPREYTNLTWLLDTDTRSMNSLFHNTIGTAITQCYGHNIGDGLEMQDREATRNTLSAVGKSEMDPLTYTSYIFLSSLPTPR